MMLIMKTTSDIELKLNELLEGLQVSSKSAVIRIAIAISLTINGDPRNDKNGLKHYDLKELNGMDYHRLTIYGIDERLYKVLMQQHLEKSLSDEDFFPELTFFHLERGIKKLYADFKLAKTRDKYLMKVLKKEV